MNLSWYGHSCFLVESREGSLVFDPYAPGSVPGLRLPELQADAVLCSHSHSDHCRPQAVRLSGREPAFRVQRFKTWHDDRQGRLRGENIISLVEAEGIRAVHLGDLGHGLSPEQAEALGRVDVLMLPVGGFYTIDAAAAWDTVLQLSPALIIPMHYRGEGFGFENISTLEPFLALAGDSLSLESSSFELSLPEKPLTCIPRCPIDV